MTPWNMVMAVRWEAQVEKAFQSPPAEGSLSKALRPLAAVIGVHMTPSFVNRTKACCRLPRWLSVNVSAKQETIPAGSIPGSRRAGEGTWEHLLQACHKS